MFTLIHTVLLCYREQEFYQKNSQNHGQAEPPSIPVQSIGIIGHIRQSAITCFTTSLTQRNGIRPGTVVGHCPCPNHQIIFSLEPSLQTL